MVEQKPCDLNAMRRLLLTAFNAQELRELFYCAESPDLHPVMHEFADNVSIDPSPPNR